jgi:hydroxyethylthiazole kinase-like uncharacterized protein yjeF
VISAYCVDSVRSAEAAAAAHLADGELMQRAAAALARALDGIATGDLVVVLAGPGDNGGDALYAAVHLLDRGVRVDIARLDDDRVHHEAWNAAVAAGARVVDEPTGQRWCLDGMFGIGARPGLSGRAREWAQWARASGVRTIAVDVPSGVDVDGATTPGPHVVAERTVTFGAHKIALLAGPAAEAAGQVDLVDIGLELDAPDVEALDASDGFLMASAVPDIGAHKYTRGVVGIAAGSLQYPGAAHLAVAGAQAGTAGMVRFGGNPQLADRVIDRAPEVVAGPGRVQSWVVGPGGGDEAQALLATALSDRVPTVVDADALRFLDAPVAGPALLTPHAGELAAMLGTDRSAVESDPLKHAVQAAERWDATVLLKGARTLVATPGRPVRVNLTGNPWLATAGAGDVLAGFAGSLLASGLDPHDAGSIAAYLHGLAAEACAGPLTASDIAATLPLVTIQWLAAQSGANSAARTWSDDA